MKAYIINLRERKDKREFMEKQMNEIGISYHIFEAYTPNTIPEHIEDIFSRKKSKLTPGEKACYASHLGVMRLVLEKGDELALILEDDAIIMSDFYENTEEIVQAVMQNGIDRLNLRHRKRACSVKKIHLPSGVSLVKPWAPSLSGAAYIITKSGTEKFLQYIEMNEFLLPLDFQFREAYWKNNIENWEMKGSISNIFDSDIDKVNGNEKRQKIRYITRGEIVKESINYHGIIKSIKCYPAFMFHAYRRKVKRRFKNFLARMKST